MEKQNVINKIQSISELFKNIRDTLSYEEISDIRLKIYRNEKIYEYYSSKTESNKNQREKLNDAIDNLNNLHEYLSNKNKKHKYGNNVFYGLDEHEFNEHEYYKPIDKKYDGMENMYFMKVTVVILVLYMNILKKLNLIYMI